MKSGIIKKVFSSIINFLKNVEKGFTSNNAVLPLEFIRIKEKFDVVQKLPYRGWIFRPHHEERKIK
jgi:hypothetical protein